MRNHYMLGLGGALLAATALSAGATIAPMPTLPGVRNRGPVFAPEGLRAGMLPTIYRAPDDGGNGGGGSVDPNDPAVKALLEAAVADAVKGLKKNNEDLRKEKDNQKARLDELQTKLESLGDLDLNAVSEFVKRTRSDEYAALYKAGKFSEVIDKEVEKAVTKVKRDMQALQEQLDQATKATTEAKTALKTERIRNKVATSVKDLNEGALDDIQRNALDLFDEDENGAIILKDGVNARTKDGKAVTVDTLQTFLLETKPYYFKGSSGGGARGGGQPGGKGGPMQIPKSDTAAIAKHQADIATGKVIVVDG